MRVVIHGHHPEETDKMKGYKLRKLILLPETTVELLALAGKTRLILQHSSKEIINLGVILTTGKYVLSSRELFI